ncbi:hypothetical protein [Bacteroides acidifaciens]|uniref:hypothetical protein n=1 Tax=Bacteroides acidifaciens TaxID=85831 RepID=UPI002582B8D8|nr:hypothetical protein [Bacteroides acidifaciens]
MAVYHLCLKTQLSDEWMKRCNAFFNELEKCGCKELPNHTFEVDEANLEAITKLTEKYGIEIILIK